MIRNRRRQKLAFLRSSLLSLLPWATSGQAGCSISQPMTYGIVHQQVISIRTDVLFNTTFHPIPEVAVTIENAPTLLDGITTLYYTEMITHHRSSSTRTEISHTRATPETSPTAAETTFLLAAMGIGNHHNKRQSGQWYMTPGGTISNDCTTSPIYTILSGVLTATINGTVYTYSTSPNLPFAAFIPPTVPGTIDTMFTLGSDETLTWTNPDFYNGQASFCAVSNGTVYAVFQENGQPDGCFYISLSLFSISSCQGISLATITGPPGVSTERLDASKLLLERKLMV